MSKRFDWLIPLGLILLCLVPILGGAVRIGELSGNSTITPHNARFFTAPGVVITHIICSLVYGVLGAFQFSRGFRRRFPQWHRKAGTLLMTFGLLSALTGLWMTQCFPHVPTDGEALYYIRLAVGTAMTVCHVFAIAAIGKKKFRIHGAWMMRGYALGMGAGTQVFTHLPWVIAIGSSPTGAERDVAMAAGWLINILVAEWILRWKTPQRPILATQH